MPSLNIYTHAKYAFHIFLSHAAIWKEHGLLTTKGGPMTNSGQITALLKAAHLPKYIGIIHFQSPQTNNSIISRGKQWAEPELQPSKAQTHLTHHRESIHYNLHPTTYRVTS